MEQQCLMSNQVTTTLVQSLIQERYIAGEEELMAALVMETVTLWATVLTNYHS